MVNIKEKIYQMFILGLDGLELEKNPNLINALQSGLGGVIFFTQNIKTVEQFKHLILDIKEKSMFPPFLSIDQEGGRVERTENIFAGKKYLSAKFAAQKGENFLKKQTEQIAGLLNNFGINLNFAPVVDVNTNPDNPIIGVRAFSNDTDEVIKFGKIVAETYIKNGITPCLKHFPGHGDANVDSHITLPKIDLSLEEMEKTHIRPFKEIESPMVMVAHMHCSAFDEESLPSSLSKNVIGYLRNNLNYKGLVITDDMVMGALGEKGKGKEEKEIQTPLNIAIQAINAGVNILLYRNSDEKTLQIIEDIAQRASDNKELSDNIGKSFELINTYKNNNFAP